jgi:uncharacterized protein with GYD domain
MTTYVSLINWTDQGIKNYRDTTQRAADFTKLAESNGGHVRELLWTVGDYDIVCVVDFPDEETGVAALLQVGSAGNIRSKTMRAQHRGDGWHHPPHRLTSAGQCPKARPRPSTGTAPQTAGSSATCARAPAVCTRGSAGSVSSGCARTTKSS